jgi:hypothetical protein
MTTLADAASRTDGRTMAVALTASPSMAPGGAVPRRRPGPSTGGDTTSVTALLHHRGRTRARELAELRAVFNRPSRGGWAILYDPLNGGCWIAVRGRAQTLCARTADELGDRIVYGAATIRGRVEGGVR